MSADTPSSTAFDPAAPAAERYDAQAELSKAHRPVSSDLIPAPEIQRVIDYIQDQYAEARLHKAQVIPFPGRQKERERGGQSVFLDHLQIFAHGDYWDKPAPIGFDSLRGMVDQTPVLSSVVMTRIRQVQRFCQIQEDDGPGFVIRHMDKDHSLTHSEEESIKLLQRFMLNCGWEWNPRARKRLRRDTLTRMMAKSVRDTLTMDASPIETEFKRDRKLGIDGFYAVDGATIRLCSEDGYRGDDEVFALQVLQGRIVTAYTFDDLIYEVRNPRSDVRLTGYGLGETELLLRVVTGFLNAMTYNIKGFDDNSIPHGLLHLSGDYSTEDLSAFRRYWNAMVRGINNAWTLPVLVSKDQESKAAFERFGIEFNEMYFSKWMTFLTSMICAVYGMAPEEINFESFAASRSALSGSDTEEKLTSSRDLGLLPLLSHYESLFTEFVIAEYGDKYCFRWTGLEEEDAEKRHEMRKMLLTVNEARAEEGYDKLEGPLGDAPLNPSLIGPWMQSQQSGQEDYGQPGQDFGGGGDFDGQGGSPQKGDEQPQEQPQQQGAGGPPAGSGPQPPPEQGAPQGAPGSFGKGFPTIYTL